MVRYGAIFFGRVTLYPWTRYIYTFFCCFLSAFYVDVNARDCKRLGGARGSNTHESKLVAKGKLGALIKSTPEIYGGENTYFSLNLVRFLPSVTPD